LSTNTAERTSVNIDFEAHALKPVKASTDASSLSLMKKAKFKMTQSKEKRPEALVLEKQ
jgi:hypothetical protein